MHHNCLSRGNTPKLACGGWQDDAGGALMLAQQADTSLSADEMTIDGQHRPSAVQASNHSQVQGGPVCRQLPLDA